MSDDQKPCRAKSFSEPLCDKDHGEEIYERLKARGMQPSTALQIMADLCLGIPMDDDVPTEAES